MHDLQALKSRLPEFLTAIGHEPRFTGDNKLTCRCPLHLDKHPSFSASRKDGVWLWKCFPCGSGGTIIELQALRAGLHPKQDFKQIVQEIAAVLNVPTAVGHATPHVRPLPAPRPPAGLTQTEDMKKACQREAWPKFLPLAPSAIQTIAQLRKLPANAVEKCANAGYLRGAEYENHKCFIITEGTFAQARRGDGGMLETGGGPKKAKNLLGSQGAFIGQKWLGETPPIVLVEGCVGLIEATAAILLAERTDWTCLAATSAGSRFAKDPDLLAKLRGRRVRILPDNDNSDDDEIGSGEAAALIWIAELESAGATVDPFPLPDGCKDLGDAMANHEQHTEFLTELFSL